MVEKEEESIIKLCKDNKRFCKKLLNIFNESKYISEIKLKYNLMNLDIFYIFKNDLELKEYKCPVCGKDLHVSSKNFSKGFPITCSKECNNKNPDRVNKIKSTIINKYGVDNIMYLSETKNKIKSTNLKRYGVECHLNNEEIKNKIKSTIINKYGVDNVFKSDHIQEQIKSNNLSKYGVEYSLQRSDVRLKCKETILNKYGVEHITQSPEIKLKIRETCLKRYNVDNVLKDINIKNKISNTLEDKYGDKLISKTDHFKSKIKDTIYKNTYNYILELSNKDKTIIPLFTKSEYKGGKFSNKYKWKCLKCGNTFEDYYFNGELPVCRVCNPKTISKPQQEIIDFIKTIYNDEIIVNTKQIIYPLELDIYLPDINLAIEFNGNYWHSKHFGKDSNYHLNKLDVCESKNIKLINIFEYDWLDINKQNKIKNRLDFIINKNNKKIFARKCEVKEIDIKTSNLFLDKYHLQGSTNNSTINLGLFYDNKLISVMTFGKPRFNKNYEYELLRYSSSIRIVGGASKLLKYFENKYKPNNIISYANRCWSNINNNVYKNLGFNLINKSKPSYVYVNRDKVLSRYQCQKYKLKDILGVNFDKTKSETENMLINGYYKLYDCGNLVYLKTY